MDAATFNAAEQQHFLEKKLNLEFYVAFDRGVGGHTFVNHLCFYKDWHKMNHLFTFVL